MKKILLLGVLVLMFTGAIFYFVTTTIVEDKGITVKLPPWSSEERASEALLKVKERNILKVVVNEKGEAIIRDEKVALENIRELVKEFIANPQGKENFATRPDEAIVSLQNKRTTPYKSYLNVYNELKGAYNELWDAEARKQFNKDFEALSREQQRAIRKIIPLVISEAEPSGF